VGYQVSDEAERSLLVKLKTECGYQFTSKLESMFTDIKTSRDTMQEFKATRRASASADEADIDLSVQVLCAHRQRLNGHPLSVQHWPAGLSQAL
jgi:cullin 3